MDSVLSPREIQTRIRSGASLEDVVAAAGMPPDRVERFAAPVLAEREHVAAQARSASVRRRGETSGHRTLRAVLGDRLRSRGLDADAATWDSYRLETGRWAVVAGYELDGESRQAIFHYDPQGRFSVAANEHARWVVGEAAPGTVIPPTPDLEPTIDLSDDLALVRAVQEPPVHAAAAAEAEVLASVQPIRPNTVVSEPASAEANAPIKAAPVAPAPVAPAPADPAQAAPAQPAQPGGAHADPEPVTSVMPDPGEPVSAGAPAHHPANEPSAIATLYEMLGYEPLGGDGYSEDSPRVYAGLSGTNAPEPVGDPADVAGAEAASAASPRLSPAAATGAGADAVAVPEAAAARGAGWEPAIVVAYPVEPGLSEDGEALEVEVPEASDDPGRAEPPVAIEDRHTEAEALEDEQDEQERTDASLNNESDALIDAPTPAPAPKSPAGRRRRASVPSWDEIMFGGPKKS